MCPQLILWTQSWTNARVAARAARIAATRSSSSALVEQSLQPGVSVSRLARQHDVNTNQIFAWRKAYQEGRLGATAFVPIILAETDSEDAPEMLETPAAAFGRLTIERKGARLTVEGRPDAQVLAQVLAVLLR